MFGKKHDVNTQSKKKRKEEKDIMSGSRDKAMRRDGAEEKEIREERKLQFRVVTSMQRCQELASNRVKLPPNTTNMGLSEISFSTFWLSDPILKSPSFVAFEDNLTQFGPNLDRSVDTSVHLIQIKDKGIMLLQSQVNK